MVMRNIKFNKSEAKDVLSCVMNSEIATMLLFLVWDLATVAVKGLPKEINLRFNLASKQNLSGITFNGKTIGSKRVLHFTLESSEASRGIFLNI